MRRWAFVTPRRQPHRDEVFGVSGTAYLAMHGCRKGPHHGISNLLSAQDLGHIQE